MNMDFTGRQTLTIGRLLTVVLAALLLGTGTVAAQEAPTAPADAHVREDYRIGPGDLLSIRIGEVGKYEQIRVSNSGKIHAPHLGILRVHDLTVAELEASIAGALREKGLINNPVVQVNVTKPLSKPVYILGEVIIPGQFVLVDDMHVLDLVVLGGGLNELATPRAHLYRRKALRSEEEAAQAYNSTDWADEVLTIDFERIASGQDPDVKLQAGDVLYVPERKQHAFFVTGDVAHPGRFPYPQTGSHRMSAVSSIAVSDRPFRITEAIATAGGPLRTAKKSKSVLVRFDSDGIAQEIPFDLAAVMDGREPDVTVEPNDIIYVPGSGTKSFGISVMRILPTLLVAGLLF